MCVCVFEQTLYKQLTHTLALGIKVFQVQVGFKKGE